MFSHLTHLTTSNEDRLNELKLKTAIQVKELDKITVTIKLLRIN